MTELRCSRDDCGRTFEGDESAESVRCPACGHKQEPNPAAVSATADGDDTLQLDASAGATITVTIEITPGVEQ